MAVFSPLNKLPNRQECTVLIVGDEGSGKHDLGLAMLDLKSQYSLQVRTATALPLPENKTTERPRIDFMAFIIDVTVENSMKIIEKSLPRVDVRYFVGRSCLIVTGVKSPDKRIIEMDSVVKLAESYDLPIIFGEVKYESDLKCLASKLNKTLEIAAGCKAGISPMLIDSTASSMEQEL